MAYSRAACRLTIDNPNCDGQITLWGIGRDWGAAEPKEQSGGQWSFDVAGQYGWNYNGQFEYLDKLKAIAPLGSIVEMPMVLDDWTVDTGKWRILPAVGSMRVDTLHCYDSSVAYASATTVDSFTPNLAFVIWHYPAGPEETRPAYIEIHFKGDGSCPEYMLCFPRPAKAGTGLQTQMGDSLDRQYTKPFLAGRAQGSATWAFIDELGGSGGSGKKEKGEEAAAQDLTTEYIDGWLVVSTDARNDWAYSGMWTDAEGVRHNFAMTAGPIQIIVVGQTAAFEMEQLTYPASTILRPRSTFATSEALFEQTPVYRIISTEPAGTDIVASYGTQPGGVTYPELTFTSGGATRACLYALQEYRAATIGNASSVPAYSDANPNLRIVSASGECTDKWRGATFEAKIQAWGVNALATLKTNDKILVDVAADATGWTPIRQFTGYNTPLEKIIEGSMLRPEATLHAADIIEARLVHKRMYWHCSYGGWPIKDAFEYILNRAGVPAALIAVDAAITSSNYILPVGNPQGDLRFEFKPDTEVTAALDQLAEAMTLQWGVKQSGIIFLRPPLVHTAGASDLTLDSSSMTDTDTLLSFRAVRNVDDFYNILVVLAGQGFDMTSRFLMDAQSIATPAAEQYVGDDWWRVEAQSELVDVDAFTAQLWAKRLENSKLVYWKTQYHPGLFPDHYVKVKVPGVGIADNNIFRVTSKRWSEDNETGRYEQELEGVIVEEGTPDV